MVRTSTGTRTSDNSIEVDLDRSYECGRITAPIKVIRRPHDGVICANIPHTLRLGDFAGWRTIAKPDQFGFVWRKAVNIHGSTRLGTHYRRPAELIAERDEKRNDDLIDRWDAASSNLGDEAPRADADLAVIS